MGTRRIKKMRGEVILFTWGLGCLWFCVGLFAANLIWLVIYWRDRRVAEREHDSTCERISREGRTENDRLIEIISTFQSSTRIHKEYAADQEITIENLTRQRDEHAKRILSLEDLYRDKCKETGAMNREINAGRDVRASALELSEILSQFVKEFEGRLNQPLDAITAQSTFIPKRPEDQPQKPTCDN